MFSFSSNVIITSDFINILFPAVDSQKHSDTPTTPLKEMQRLFAILEKREEIAVFTVKNTRLC